MCSALKPYPLQITPIAGAGIASVREIARCTHASQDQVSGAAAPAWHSSQMPSESALTLVENFPGSQCRQYAGSDPRATSECAYFPTGHSMHRLDPATAYVAGSQSTHTLALVAAVTFEYLPPAHWRHADEFVCPTAVEEYLPATHSRHAVAPMLPWYVPAVQFKHTVDPVMCAYFPASHTSHDAVPAFTAREP